MVHLLSQGFVLPVMTYISACWSRQDTDISLIRHFVTEVQFIVYIQYKWLVGRCWKSLLRLVLKNLLLFFCHCQKMTTLQETFVMAVKAIKYQLLFVRDFLCFPKKCNRMSDIFTGSSYPRPPLSQLIQQSVRSMSATRRVSRKGCALSGTGFNQKIKGMCTFFRF